MPDPFFGDRWDAPLIDEADQVPTPIGQSCFRCGELVAAGDRGLIRMVARELGGELQAAAEPVHAECDLIGVVGHLVGVCHCTGYDTSTRAAARLAWQRAGEQRGRALAIRANARQPSGGDRG